MLGGTKGKNWPKYKLSSSTTYSSNSTISNLCAGTYTLNLIDSFGCTADTQIVIKQPAKLTIGVNTITNVDCKGNSTGSFSVIGSGGVSPYLYNISGGTYGSSNSFSALKAGSYTVGIKDKNGCVNTITVTITEPTRLILSIANTSNILCFGGNTGSITVSASGGTTPYGYNINGSSYNTTGSFTSLKAGSYIINVKDANGCLDSDTIVLT
jgi:hypothetical protein